MKAALTLILMAVAFPAFAVTGTIPSIREIVWDVVQLLGIGVIFGILYYLVGAAPFINDVFKKLLQYAIILIGALLAIFVILGFLGL